tara:strand:+ start:2072 stop:2260 length:189 start_codon:yes stop_codon:yes gene_type:complete
MIGVNPLAQMEFAHEGVAAINTPVGFKNNCLNAISYLWDFRDGNKSTGFAPNTLLQTMAFTR